MSSALSRNSARFFDAALSDAVASIQRAVSRVAATNPVILIDGQSGAGKTTLARKLIEDWSRRERVQLLALDSIYPGWDGLDSGVDYARERVLVPHARGLMGTWEPWDWAREVRSDTTHAVDPALALIVEGSGVLTSRTSRLADVAVWVSAPEAARKQRALARDGETYRPHWERWARQEAEHLRRDNPLSCASLVLSMP